MKEGLSVLPRVYVTYSLVKLFAVQPLRFLGIVYLLRVSRWEHPHLIFIQDFMWNRTLGHKDSCRSSNLVDSLEARCQLMD